MPHRFFRYGIALSLVVLMTWIAEYLGESEIIFPEILALAVGGWVAEKRPWKTTRFNLWLAPTAAALFGVILMRYTRLPAWTMVTVSFAFVALLLTATRSTLMPSISAAILPILIGTTSWIYPISVCLLTAAIALNSPLPERFFRQVAPALPRNPPESAALGRELLFWGKLLIAVTLVTFLALKYNVLFLVAPPLIVTFVEFSHEGSPLRKYPVKVFLLLGLAAWAGMLCHSILSLHLGWPLWISSAFITTFLFICYESMEMLFPPAAAISLLPTILPTAQLPHYPWQVMAGTVLLLLTSLLFFGPVRKKGEIRLTKI
ncbi:MAG: hypothetical protein GX751_02110 [Desulfuromonadaceae bacterium]|nr:hypothetical protein [Desulfuromonadaceae bacterium]